MFCDELKIKVIGGKGGDGSVSFRREKYVPLGGPDGGDGGNGGNVVIKTSPHLNTLSHLSHKKIYKADNGVAGRGQKMYGKNGTDFIFEVPPGTVIFNHDKSQVIADLEHIGEQIIIAKGGKGGLGNTHFVSSIRQAPKFAENGEPGEEKEITLELKLVADVGIIGLPSAGKSTLISVISNARPKIAPYHFTTLIPNLGVVDMSKFGGSANDSFVAADIPGLIEGGSQGKGLGHEFLKHITRTKILIHLIDGSSENITKDYKAINLELKKFSQELAKKEQIIVINKIDIIEERALKEKIEELVETSKKKNIFTISGVTHEGLKILLFEVCKKLIEIKKKPIKKVKNTKEIPILRPHLDQNKPSIIKILKKKDYKIFEIGGKKIDQMVSMTDINNKEGLERIYIYIEKSGIKKALTRQKAEFGDIIRIKDKNIPFRS